MQPSQSSTATQSIEDILSTCMTQAAAISHSSAKTRLKGKASTCMSVVEARQEAIAGLKRNIEDSDNEVGSSKVCAHLSNCLKCSHTANQTQGKQGKSRAGKKKKKGEKGAEGFTSIRLLVMLPEGVDVSCLVIYSEGGLTVMQLYRKMGILLRRLNLVCNVLIS
jgi:hypothetical protein